MSSPKFNLHRGSLERTFLSIANKGGTVLDEVGCKRRAAHRGYLAVITRFVFEGNINVRKTLTVCKNEFNRNAINTEQSRFCGIALFWRSILWWLFSVIFLWYQSQLWKVICQFSNGIFNKIFNFDLIIFWLSSLSLIILCNRVTIFVRWVVWISL